MEEIKNLPINELADENCALFLWVTFPLLDEQIKMFKEWGFSYKTLGFSWIKTNKNDKKPCFGVGYYTKSNCEVCLLGVKGQMKPVSNKVSSVIISERREHSRKPDEFISLIEACSPGPYIELFARGTRSGWTLWGDQATDNYEPTWNTYANHPVANTEAEKDS